MTIPPLPPADLLALIERDRSALLSLLEGLEPSDWQLASPCPGWSVLDLAVHLLGDDLGGLGRHRDGHRGTPPPAEAGSEEAFVAFIDALNDAWVVAAKRLSPRLVVDLLRWTGPQLAELYRAQDPEAVTASVSWASDHPVPLWFDQARELTERWVHRQQIRQALGRPTDPDAEMLEAVLDTFSWAYPYQLSKVTRRPGTTVAVETTGAVRRRWQFTAKSAGWERTDDERPVVAELVVDADEAWRLLTNGLAVPPAPTVSEDAELARVLVRTRAIIGSTSG